MKLDHNDITLFLVQLGVLLLLARIGSELMRRAGQPSVVGEILAGVFLGPSLLTAVLPELSGVLVPAPGKQMMLIEIVSLIGALLLLLITGLEIDLPLIRRHAKTALGVTLGGLPVSFAVGYGIGLLLPTALISDGQTRSVTALFLAVCIAVSAIPVLAKVLFELHMTRRNAAQTAMAAAMFEDVSAWILLSIVVGISSGAASGLENGVLSVLKILGLLAITLTVGRWFLDRALSFLLDRTQSSETVLPFLFTMTLMWAAVAHYLHIEAVLGAFLFGILLGTTPKVNEDTLNSLSELALRIFGPVFFAIAGLRVNLIEVYQNGHLFLFILLLGAALICKPAGVYLGARIIGRAKPVEALFYSAGLACQGSTGIIIATIGLSLGILTPPLFSIVALVAITTSLVTPALMRMAAIRLPMSKDEEQRLTKELFQETSFLSSVHRVLLPLRFRPEVVGGDIPVQSRIPALLLNKLHTIGPISLNLVTVVPESDKDAAEKFLNDLQKHFTGVNVNRRVLIGEEPADLILDEAKRDYDLIVIGATQRSREQTDVVFTPFVDYLLRFAPCPVILIQDSPCKTTGENPDAIGGDILVPTNGSSAARRAAEVGFALAKNESSRVKILKVVEISDAYHNRTTQKRQLDYAKGLVQELAKVGRLLGAKTAPRVLTGTEPEVCIIEAIQEEQMALLILGTSVRVGSERLYLGPRVERMLRESACPVMIVNT